MAMTLDLCVVNKLRTYAIRYIPSSLPVATHWYVIILRSNPDLSQIFSISLIIWRMRISCRRSSPTWTFNRQSKGHAQLHASVAGHLNTLKNPHVTLIGKGVTNQWNNIYIYIHIVNLVRVHHTAWEINPLYCILTLKIISISIPWGSIFLKESFKGTVFELKQEQDWKIKKQYHN